MRDNDMHQGIHGRIELIKWTYLDLYNSDLNEEIIVQRLNNPHHRSHRITK